MENKFFDRRSVVAFFSIRFVGLLLLLSGCASTTETFDRTSPNLLQVSAMQGVVSLRVSSNRGSTSTFFQGWGTLHLKNQTTSERFTLVNRATSGAQHSLFFGAIPEGRYEIEKLGNFSSGMGSLTSTASTNSSLPGFFVKNGHLTDLGTLAYIRPHHPLNSRQFRFGIASESAIDRQTIISQFSAELAESLRERPVLGWQQDSRFSVARNGYENMREMSMRVRSPVQQDNESTLFGESFGQIAARSSEGVWSFLQLPTALPVLSLHREIDGAIFAGSEEGLLMVKRPSLTHWERISLPANDSSIIHIGRLPGTGELLVVLQGRDRFLGLSTDATAKAPFKEQFSMPRRISEGNPANDSFGYVFHGGEKLIFAQGGFRGETRILEYSQSTKGWNAVPAGEGGVPSVWVSMKNGDIGRFAGIPLTGMYFAASEDAARTWQRRGELNWGTPPRFVTDLIGYCVRIDARAAFDAEKTEYSVWRTVDGGRSWRLAGSPKTAGGTIVPLGGPEIIGYASESGKFFVSKDGGKSWQLEREID